MLRPHMDCVFATVRDKERGVPVHLLNAIEFIGDLRNVCGNDGLALGYKLTSSRTLAPSLTGYPKAYQVQKSRHHVSILLFNSMRVKNKQQYQEHA